MVAWQMKPNLKQEAKKLRQEIKRELKAQTSEFSARIQRRRLKRLGAITTLLLLLWLLPQDCATESIPRDIPSRDNAEDATKTASHHRGDAAKTCFACFGSPEKSS